MKMRSLKTVLRLVSLLMLVAAAVFLAVALTHPELGTVFYIGGIAIGAAVWRVFYIVYFAVMIGLFTASFFVSNGEKE